MVLANHWLNRELSWVGSMSPWAQPMVKNTVAVPAKVKGHRVADHCQHHEHAQHD
jgi:hypothetical protein